MRTITIVGVGLMGGSLALALRKYGFAGRILGVSSARTIRLALERGVIDQGATLEEAAPQSDVIYLAQPISRILEALPAAARLAPDGALVTDAGSTKAAIANRAVELFTGRSFFVGGHPMAGKAERGVEAAEADLFQGATYVLTPLDRGLPEGQVIEAFCGWLERIGTRLVVMNPEAHDRLVAFSSHLPQLASTALASVVGEQAAGSPGWRVSGGGLRDMTRLALSAYDLWRDIVLTNSPNIERALSAYIQKLEHVRENLRSRALEEEFRRGAELAGRVRTE